MGVYEVGYLATDMCKEEEIVWEVAKYYALYI
jgi:hypothetical protein